MNLNSKQILSIVMVVLGVMTASTAQLTDLFGPTTTKAVIGLAGMLNSILAGILAIFNSQSGTLKDVQSMDGVDKIIVNSKANETLATLAVDPMQTKIEASSQATSAVVATAKGAE